MRTKKLKFVLFGLAVLFAGLIPMSVSAATEEADINDCIHSENGGWIDCPVIESIQNSVEGLYSFLIENWLAINPKLLSFSGSGDAGASVHDAWQYFQVLANILLIVYLLVIIVSQITGFGISNYGVKQALPRVVLAAITINLSYIICQAAVDLANIVGNGIFNLMDSFIENTGIVAAGTNDTGYSIALLAILVVVIGYIVFMAFTSPAFISVALMSLVSALIAVLFLFVVLGIRQVLTVLLVVVSPIALLCSTVPGLRNVYKKWFELAKGLLLAYPVCSVMIGGGSLASQILYDVWDGDEHFFAAVACMIVCVAPFFFIPSVVFKSIGALNAVVDKVRNGSGKWKGVEGLARKGYSSSDLSRRLDRAEKKKRVYRRAGIKTDLRGNAKVDENGRLAMRRNRKGKLKGDARYYDAAYGLYQRQKEVEAHEAALANGQNLVRDRENQDMISEFTRSINGKGLSSEGLAGGLSSEIENLSKLTSGGSKWDDKAIRESRAKIAAYSKLMAGTAEGRTLLRRQLAYRNNTNGAINEAEATQAMFAGMDNAELAELTRHDALLGNYGFKVRANGVAGAGSFMASANQTYTSQMLEGLTAEDWATMDETARMEMMAQAVEVNDSSAQLYNVVKDDPSNTDPNAPTHLEINSNYFDSGFTVKDNDFATNLARLSAAAGNSVDIKAKSSLQSQQLLDAMVQQRASQVESLRSGYESSGATVAQLMTSYGTEAGAGRSIQMSAIEAELSRLGVGEAQLEALRQGADSMNATARAGAAFDRAQKK